MPNQNVFDSLNTSTYSVPEFVETFQRRDGYTDDGEAVALSLVTEECRGRPILDIGVGGGRTLPLLRAISSDYRAIDYTPEMVNACRARFPDARVDVGDARNLEAFADGSLGLVVFSFNGLDGIAEEDRLAVLRNVHRVLAPDGVFLFSSHNRDGLETRHQTGAMPRFVFPSNPLRLPFRIAGFLKRYAIAYRAYRKYRAHDVWERDYAILFCSVRERGLMIYHARRELTEQQLREAGFAGEITVVDNVGDRLARDSDTSRARWFHFIVHK